MKDIVRDRTKILYFVGYKNNNASQFKIQIYQLFVNVQDQIPIILIKTQRERPWARPYWMSILFFLLKFYCSTINTALQHPFVHLLHTLPLKKTKLVILILCQLKDVL